MNFDLYALKESVIDLFTNRVMMCAVFSWLIAQYIKVFTSPKNRDGMSVKSFLVGTGGMPSSHSAAVCSTCFSCGILYGFDSPYFAIAGVLAVIVMRDATGVRRESGKQAAAINHMSRELSEVSEDFFLPEKLSELLGHTPLQVFFGALLGIAMAFVCQLWFFPLIFPAM